MCACTLVYVTCLNSISRQRGDPDESLLPLEPELSRFSIKQTVLKFGKVTRNSFRYALQILIQQHGTVFSTYSNDSGPLPNAMHSTMR